MKNYIYLLTYMLSVSLGILPLMDTSVPTDCNIAAAYKMSDAAYKNEMLLLELSKPSILECYGPDALYGAVISGNLVLVEHLLKKGINPNKLPMSTETPIIINALSHSLDYSKNEKLVELLLKYNAKINVVSNGFPTLEYFLIAGQVNPVTGEVIDPLKVKNIIALLIKHHVNVNAVNRSDNATALHHVAARGKTDIAQLLLDNGADINLQDKYGRTALMRAAVNGHITMVELLLNPHYHVKINTENSDGATVLDLAEEFKSQCDSARDVCYGLGTERDFDKVIETLKEHGALPGPNYKRKVAFPTTTGTAPDDDYALLGIARGSTKQQIREAYKQSALKWHPDKNTGNIVEAEQMMQKINVAYERILKDITKE